MPLRPMLQLEEALRHRDSLFEQLFGFGKVEVINYINEQQCGLGSMGKASVISRHLSPLALVDSELTFRFKLTTWSLISRKTFAI